MSQLPEYVDGVPNVSGNESQVDQAVAAGANHGDRVPRRELLSKRRRGAGCADRGGGGRRRGRGGDHVVPLVPARHGVLLVEGHAGDGIYGAGRSR